MHKRVVADIMRREERQRKQNKWIVCGAGLGRNWALCCSASKRQNGMLQILRFAVTQANIKSLNIKSSAFIWIYILGMGLTLRHQ